MTLIPHIKPLCYVSCFDDHTVSKFSLTEMYHVKRIGCISQTKYQNLHSRFKTLAEQAKIH